MDCSAEVAPRQFTSGVFLSPNGRYRAFIHVVSRAATKPTVGAVGCVATSELFVQSPEDKDFRLALQDRGDPERHDFRSALPVDWSPDGRHLLLWVHHGTYGTDEVWDIIRLYDAPTGTLTEVNYLEVMRRFYGKPEWHGGNARVLGFTPQGEVVFEIWRTGEEYDNDSCGEERFGFWAVSPTTLAARRLPADYKVQRYGRVEERAPKK